jgi:outer membrane lipoprotein-sorting protein
MSEGPIMKRGLSYFFALMLFVAAHGASQAQKGSSPEKRSPGKQEESKATPEGLDPQIAIQLADDYFNAARFMTADFVQVGVDGRRSEGKLYVSKPGKLRFEYAQPATMEIIADGVSVAIRDRQLQTQQIYFIGQTPLKFLLQEHLKLKRDVKITNVSSDARLTIITLEDTATFGGTSKIKLAFENKNFGLKQWEVTDPQGYQTLVSLHNVDLKSVPDIGLFRIPSNELWPSQN